MIWKISLVMFALAFFIFPMYLEIYARVTGRTLTVHDRAVVPFILIATMILSIIALSGSGIYYLVNQF